MIQFACPKCKHSLRAPVDAAGRTARCRKCETRIRIPQAGSKTKTATADHKKPPVPPSEAKRPVVSEKPPEKADDPRAALLAEIRSSFEGQVPRNSLNLPYQASLLAVAAMMILLPLLYVGLILVACYGMYWYCTTVLPNGMDSLPAGRGAFFGMLMYVAPILAGVITILFMIKPLFFVFVKPREARRRSLSRGAEPMLFELVDRICEVTRSPKPKRIDIDNEVNASASLRRGFISLFGRDLVLTIGAPLIAGMNTRQLVGVLAHEFGHFAQGGGMKTTFLIRNINDWFARVVYQRDQFDEMLDAAIRESDFRISLLLLFSKLFVLISRGVLWCFMMLAHIISCMMMRQMEYDADRYEAVVAGSKQFENTSQRLNQLVAGQQETFDAIVKSLGDRLFLDDLPGLTAKAADQASHKALKRIEAISEHGTSGLFSTHPATSKRIKAAKKFKADGLFQIERPARYLLKNYDAICSGVTVDFYRNQLNVMVSVEQLTKQSSESAA